MSGAAPPATEAEEIAELTAAIAKYKAQLAAAEKVVPLDRADIHSLRELIAAMTTEKTQLTGDADKIAKLRAVIKALKTQLAATWNRVPFKPEIQRIHDSIAANKRRLVQLVMAQHDGPAGPYARSSRCRAHALSATAVSAEDPDELAELTADITKYKAQLAAAEKAVPLHKAEIHSLRRLITAMTIRKNLMTAGVGVDRAAAAVDEKTVFVEFPEGWMWSCDLPRSTRTVRFRSNEDLRMFCSGNQGYMFGSDDLDVLTFHALVDGQTCNFHHFDDERDSKDLLEVQMVEGWDRELAEEATRVMQSALGDSAHMRSGVVYPDPSTNLPPLFQLDSVVVVHVGGESVAPSTVFVLESERFPTEDRVSALLHKVDLFKKYAPRMPHCRSVSNVVPVLAAHSWEAKHMEQCVAKGVSRVQPRPTGSGYQFVRQFSTLAKRIITRR